MALDTFGNIVQQTPHFVPAHAYQAVVLSELGRVKEAREPWNKASHLTVGSPSCCGGSPPEPLCA